MAVRRYLLLHRDENPSGLGALGTSRSTPVKCRKEPEDRSSSTNCEIGHGIGVLASETKTPKSRYGLQSNRKLIQTSYAERERQPNYSRDRHHAEYRAESKDQKVANSQ